MRRHRTLLLWMLLVIPAATAVWSARAARTDTLTLATWNLEWLVSPRTAHAARLACRNAQRTTLPCDVARQLARDSADLARLAAYARELDADIVAFQEVEDAAIARRIFRGYDICIAGGPGVQHVGFAVRAGIPHTCGPEISALSLRGRSRSAMSMQLPQHNAPPIRLLAVHLKSGCSRDPLDSDSAACRMLQQQARHLGEWIASQAAAHTPFIVLGDFNRMDPETQPDDFWQLLHPETFTLLAGQLPFRNCYLGQPYSRFIDHILVAHALASRIVPSEVGRVTFRNPDVVRYRLSDHCPVRLSLNTAAHL